VAAVALACFAASDTARTRAQQATFRARIDVVSVAVSVMKGREPMSGLGSADFELTDNGARQSVGAVSLEHVPIDVTLLVSEFPIGRTSQQDRTLASAEATRQLLLPADRLRVVLVDDEVSGRLVGPEYSVLTDRATQGMTAGVGLANGFSVSSVDGKQGWGVALADGLFYALARPVDPDRRHLVVAFTDGRDTASTLDMDTLPKLAAHSDAVLHAVFWATPADGAVQSGGGWTSNPSANRPEWEASYRLVDETVQRTGGTLQLARQAPNALASIIADFRSSYVLRYTPRGVTPAGWHDLQVKVTRPGSFKIRARKGYEGGGESRTAGSGG
jgi:VWFA-related protein